jgi:hypothetical protein
MSQIENLFKTDMAGVDESYHGKYFGQQIADFKIENKCFCVILNAI